MIRLLSLILTCLLVALALPAWPDVNIDSAIAAKSMEVKKFVISGEDDSIGSGINLSQLLQEAESLRAEYPLQMTFTEIALIGDKLTAILRDRGYKFHYVVLPRQNARTGIVRLDLIEVILDDVSLLGDIGPEVKQLQNFFSEFISKPVFQPAIDEKLRSLQRRPEFSFFSYYSRGARPNSVRLNIRATKRDHHLATTSVDNFGSESSGHNRLSTNYSWLSPLGNFDKLDVSLMYADGGATNLYGSLAYQHPLTSLNNHVSVYVANNQYDVGQEFALLELKGEALLAGASFSQAWLVSDFQTHNLSLSLDKKTVTYDNVFNDPSLTADEDATIAKVDWQWQIENSTASLQQATLLSFAQGDHELTGSIFYKDRFKYVYANSTTVWLPASHQVRLSITGLFANKSLPSFEKLALTGVNAARGFYAGQFSADKGARANISWQLPSFSLYQNNQMAGFIFADVAQGQRFDVNGDQLDKATLGSAGIGMRANLSEKISARLQWSVWTSATMKNSLEPTELPVIFDLQYRW